jgi:predicted alpha/beta hydrolase family esterase
MNCIIIHGSPSKSEKSMNPETRTYDKHWIPWVKLELEKREIYCYTPLMPEPWEPKYLDWKNEIEKLSVDGDSVLVGHSSGGGFLVRWLGETKKRVNKLILVAPAISYSDSYKPLQDLLVFNINKEIIQTVGKIFIFASKDDSNGILKSVDIFSKSLNVFPIFFKKHGHFTLEDMGTEKFPELLEVILK